MELHDYPMKAAYMGIWVIPTSVSIPLFVLPQLVKIPETAVYKPPPPPPRL